MSPVDANLFRQYALCFLSACALLVALAACGAGGGMDLPAYPRAQYQGGQQSFSGVRQLDKSTVYQAAYESFDNYEDVVKFYQAEVAKRPGWKGGAGRDVATWTDGNMTLNRTLDTATPTDPSKPGGLIQVFKGEGKVYIQLARSVPK